MEWNQAGYKHVRSLAMRSGPCPESRYTQEHSQKQRATSHFETSLCAQSEDVAGDRGLPHSAISSSAIMGEGWKESGDPGSCFPSLFCRKETHLRECRPAVHIQTEPSHLGVSEHIRNEGSLCSAWCVVACPFHGGTQRQTQKSMEAVLP